MPKPGKTAGLGPAGSGPAAKARRPTAASRRPGCLLPCPQPSYHNRNVCSILRAPARAPVTLVPGATRRGRQTRRRRRGWHAGGGALQPCLHLTPQARPTRRRASGSSAATRPGCCRLPASEASPRSSLPRLAYATLTAPARRGGCRRSAAMPGRLSRGVRRLVSADWSRSGPISAPPHREQEWRGAWSGDGSDAGGAKRTPAGAGGATTPIERLLRPFREFAHLEASGEVLLSRATVLALG